MNLSFNVGFYDDSRNFFCAYVTFSTFSFLQSLKSQFSQFVNLVHLQSQLVFLQYEAA